PGLDLPRRLDAALPRHADIHQHQARLQRIDFLDRLLAIARGPDDLDPRLEAQEADETVTHELVVIDNQQSYHSDSPPEGRSTSPVGTVTTTMVPAPGVLAMRSVPPSISARSRIPAIPRCSP